jgi:hypothetical protein
MLTILLPIVSAIIGVAGGLLVAHHQARSTKTLEIQKAADIEKAAFRNLALEIVKLEFERAALEGRTSTHSILAHWSIVAALMEESRVKLDDPELVSVIGHLSNYYTQFCWGHPHADENGRQKLISSWDTVEGTVHPVEVLRSAKQFLSDEVEELERKQGRIQAFLAVGRVPPEYEQGQPDVADDM